ncbi:RRP15-like protein [Fopius arisanus]|uniref:RRP15-like protein n=1 Tax=Fopius arisanus TaxID=64838 RepID=A0A0C9QLD3_9HYME|nr:PREDICTED: RRP15-like protein [Fopius arisanus]
MINDQSSTRMRKNSLEDEDSDNPEMEQESKFMRNEGWADAMQNILKTNKPKKKTTLVLSRAKKISEVKPKIEQSPFEIESKDGEIKAEIDEKADKKNFAMDKPEKRRKEEKMKHSIRIRPSPLTRPREKILQKIATQGVVQLFNAVREQQREIEKKLVEVGPLEGKREKVLKSIDKRAFLDVLMGGTKSVIVDQQDTSQRKDDSSENDNKVWSVLRDDFIMGAKLKDWDKKTPEETDESSDAEELNSD